MAVAVIAGQQTWKENVWWWLVFVISPPLSCFQTCIFEDVRAPAEWPQAWQGAEETKAECRNILNKLPRMPDQMISPEERKGANKSFQPGFSFHYAFTNSPLLSLSWGFEYLPTSANTVTNQWPPDGFLTKNDGLRYSATTPTDSGFASTPISSSSSHLACRSSIRFLLYCGTLAFLCGGNTEPMFTFDIFWCSIVSTDYWIKYLIVLSMDCLHFVNGAGI